MAEERESQKSHAKGETDVEGHGQVGAQVGAQSGAPEADFQGHGQHPMTDDSDPDEMKTKLANDEDDDVEGHANVPSQTP